MKCSHCLRDYSGSERHCPHCDTPNPAAGLFQSSSVIIAARGSKRVYRSLEEIPARLRASLQRSTNSGNSATILIADRRGHSEITKALMGSPNASQRRLARAILGETSPGPPNWLNRFPFRRRLILAALFGLTLAVVAVVFTHAWK